VLKLDLLYPPVESRVLNPDMQFPKSLNALSEFAHLALHSFGNFEQDWLPCKILQRFYPEKLSRKGKANPLNFLYIVAFQFLPLSNLVSCGCSYQGKHIKTPTEVMIQS